MDQEQQENQRDQGLVDRLNSLYNTQRSIRRIARMAQWGSKAVPLLANPVTWIVLGVIFLLIVFIIVFSGAGGGEPPGPGDGKDKIPGLGLTLDGPSQTEYPNGIQYSVIISFDPAKSPVPLNAITVFDKLPDNTEFISTTGESSYDPTLRLVSWPLEKPKNQGGFSFVLKPTAQNFFLFNKIYATANFAPQGSGGGSCTEGSGFCSIENLSKYFPPDQTKNASIICNRESGSNLLAKNAGCLTGKSADYSIGLFQINMLVHCPGAFSSYTINPPSCTIGDASKLAACETKFRDPEENIKKAVELSQNGTNWNSWSAARVCGIIK